MSQVSQWLSNNITNRAKTAIKPYQDELHELGLDFRNDTVFLSRVQNHSHVFDVVQNRAIDADFRTQYFDRALQSSAIPFLRAGNYELGQRLDRAWENIMNIWNMFYFNMSRPYATELVETNLSVREINIRGEVESRQVPTWVRPQTARELNAMGIGSSVLSGYKLQEAILFLDEAPAFTKEQLDFIMTVFAETEIISWGKRVWARAFFDKDITPNKVNMFHTGPQPQFGQGAAGGYDDDFKNAIMKIASEMGDKEGSS